MKRASTDRIQIDLRMTGNYYWIRKEDQMAQEVLSTAYDARRCPSEDYVDPAGQSWTTLFIPFNGGNLPWPLEVEQTIEMIESM